MFTSMSRADRVAWFAPDSLNALGDVVGRWLERDVQSQPAWGDPGDGPDAETTAALPGLPHGLVPVLAAVNRLGFVTRNSQPGVPLGPGYDGAMWQQRAEVSGFASRALALRLVDLAERHGLHVVHRRGPSPRWVGWRRYEYVTISEREGRATCGSGAFLTRRHTYDLYPECNDAMCDALWRADQVSLIDPVFGRNNVLWVALRNLRAGSR